jgi:hypothetical protein
VSGEIRKAAIDVKRPPKSAAIAVSKQEKGLSPIPAKLYLKHDKQDQVRDRGGAGKEAAR